MVVTASTVARMSFGRYVSTFPFVVFSSTYPVGEIRRISATTLPFVVCANALFVTPAIEISASDQFANVTPSFNGTVTVALDHDASAFQDAQLWGHHTVTAASGVARFNDLRLDRAGVGYTLRADAPGLARVVSHSFNQTP